jgi:hypothetical protein
VTRRRLAGFVLGVWVVTLGWLVQRHYFRSTGARLAEAALAIPPGATFYRLSLGDASVGFASTTLDTLADSIRVDDVLVLDAPALGRMHRTTTRSTAIVGRTLRLRSLVVTFDGDDGRFAAQGAVADDSLLRLQLVTANDSDVARVPVTPAAVLPSVLALRLAFGGELRVGNRYAMRVFDPVSLTEYDAAYRVGAETTLIVSDSAAYDSVAGAWVAVLWDTVPAFRLDAEDGAARRIWIDGQGQVVRSEEAAGLVSERAAFEIAYENFRHRDTAAIARATAAPARGAIVSSTALAAGALSAARTEAELRLRASGLDPTSPGLVGPGQEVRGDTIVVHQVDSARLAARYLLPARDTALRAWLRAEPLIQANDPRIEAQARQIVGRERNAARATERLLAWTAGLRRAPAPGVPSAVRTLEARAGDCNELTVLFVALARAAGLPARPVAGLLLRDGRFYYHAWAEVYLGEWVPVDPMLGQLPADVGRLRVAPGLARRVDLHRLVGNLTLETL